MREPTASTRRLTSGLVLIGTACAGPLLLGGLALASRWLVLAPVLFWVSMCVGLGFTLAHVGAQVGRRRHSAPQRNPDLIKAVDTVRRAGEEGETIGLVMLAADRLGDSGTSAFSLNPEHIEAVQGTLREIDTAALWCNDIVMAIFPCEATEAEATEAIADRMRASLQEAIGSSGVLASAGWSVSQGNGSTLDDLIQRAELALQTCRRERPGSTHRSAPTDAWIDDPVKIIELQGLLAHASDMRGAPEQQHWERASIARKAAERLGHSPLYATLTECAALVWDARLAAAEKQAPASRPARETMKVRSAHLDQVIEMLEQYGALRRTPLTPKEAHNQDDILKELARLLAIVDDHQRLVASGIEREAVSNVLASADLGVHDDNLVQAVCSASPAAKAPAMGVLRTAPQASAS